MNKSKSTQQVGNLSADGKPLDSIERITDFFRRMDRPPCVSKNLKKIMEDNKLTLQKVSRRCKLPRSTIHNALVGREISMKTADKLCKGLGVSISKLVYGEEEKTTTGTEPENLLSGIFEIVVRKHIQK